MVFLHGWCRWGPGTVSLVPRSWLTSGRSMPIPRLCCVFSSNPLGREMLLVSNDSRRFCLGMMRDISAEMPCMQLKMNQACCLEAWVSYGWVEPTQLKGQSVGGSEDCSPDSRSLLPTGLLAFQHPLQRLVSRLARRCRIIFISQKRNIRGSEQYEKLTSLSHHQGYLNHQLIFTYQIDKKFF